MKIYTGHNVLEEALIRMRYIFDEFENVVVSFSGGKDSTTVLHLALQVAEEKNRLPLKVLFIDQEAEWTSVIDYVKTIMYDKRVDPYWMQIPMRLFNATSSEEGNQWLHCWRATDKEKWIHPQDPISKKENVYGTDRFAALFTAIIKKEWGHLRTANIGGVRTQESPARLFGLTSQATYKDITWGKVLSKEIDHYTFYPVYDWGYKDVWKYILDNNWDYCKLYDAMYQYGIGVNNMRVSNVHHETAVASLYFLQEIDPVVWGALTNRMSGINTTGQLKESSVSIPDKLPPMFKDWYEYRDFLLRKLARGTEVIAKFRKYFDTYDEIYEAPLIRKRYAMACITAILVNEPETKLNNFRIRADVRHFRAYLSGRRKPQFDAKNIYVRDLIEYENNKRASRKFKGKLRFSKK